MRAKLILSRLNKTIKKLEELKDENFSYNVYVAKSNLENCGTVCCVAGWYPKWFPESNLIWGPKRFKSEGLIIDLKPLYDEETILKVLSDYHGLEESYIEFLFYGNSLLLSSEEAVLFAYYASEVFTTNYLYPYNLYEVKLKNKSNSSRLEVLEAFKFIYKLLKNNRLNRNLQRQLIKIKKQGIDVNKQVE